MNGFNSLNLPASDFGFIDFNKDASSVSGEVEDLFLSEGTVKI